MRPLRGRCDVAVGSRFVSAEGYAPYRYAATPSRRFGHFLLRRLVRRRLGSPMMDATSGMFAVDAAALPVLSRPFEVGAPEVEALLRLVGAGLRIQEVAVDMRERAGGESKLQGRKAVMLVLTVGATLVFGKRLRRRR